MKKTFLYLILFFPGLAAFSHNIGSGDLNSCSGSLYDTGGGSSDYGNSENIVETYCSNSGNCISITFNVFNVESGYDELTIYDGNSTGSPLIGTYSGTTLQGTSVTSTNGCLTFEWSSDGSVTYPGWDASISCTTCPTCSDGIQNGSETGVDCGGSTCPPCPCDDQTISSLPFSQTGMTTCGFGDDYSSSDACGSSYMNGDDYVFEYTSPGSECITLSLSNTDTYTGAFLLDGCPDDPATTCIASGTSSSGNPSFGATINSSGTYYFVISTYPSPQCTPFDINITSTSTGNPGTDCANPYSISSLPFSQTGLTTSCYGDDYSSSDACGSSYMNGDDFVFEYTPSSNTSIDITLSNTSSYTGIFALDGCPDGGSTSCVAEETGTDPALTCVDLTGGTTYYFVVSTWPSPQSTDFDINITSSTYSEPTCNLNYSMATTTYNPYNYNQGTNLSFSDDRFANSVTPIGFSFCFDGVYYSDVLVSSNGYLIFPGCYSEVPPNGEPTAGGSSPWSISSAIPNTSDAPMNAILGPWQDIDPSVSGTIRYDLKGTSPNRVFVAIFDDVAMFDCNSQLFSGQIMLYESSNDIEIHIGNKTICSGWNGGDAILGLHNHDGTIAVTNSGHNYPTDWAESSTAYSFTNSCTCTPLPVEMINFKGEAKGAANVLNWTTASEINNDHFIVERSLNGLQYKAIGTVQGHGTSSESHQYRYTDNRPGSGTTYYRLRQVDFDGKYGYGKTITVFNEELVSSNTLMLYPIPANNTLNIDLTVMENSDSEIILYDVFGKAVKAETHALKKGKNSFRLNLQSVPRGLYFLKITDRVNGLNYYKKVILKD